MQLLSLTFIYLVLPLGLLVFYLVPERMRPVVLLAFSLLCFCAAQPQAFPLMASAVTMDYLVLQLLQRFDQREPLRKGILIASLMKNLMVLFYAGIIARSIEGGVVLGVSVYILLAADCVIAAYRREFTPVHDPICYGLYCCFFPRLYGGPLQSCQDFDRQLRGSRPSAGLLLEGVGRFLSGGVKVLLFGAFLSSLYHLLYRYVQAEPNALSLWSTVLALALTIYYKLSGYCDMACGIAMMFGFRLPQSFYYPYQSHSISDFFQRFHSTLWAFLDRNLGRAFPGGKQRPLYDTAVLLLMGALFGAWFELRAGTVLWGGCLALFVAAERHLMPLLHLNLPILFRRLYSLLVILLSLAFVVGETPVQGWEYLKILLLTPSAAATSPRTLHILSTNWMLLAGSLLYATSGVRLLNGLVQRVAPRVYRVLAAAGDMVLLAIATALLL